MQQRHHSAGPQLNVAQVAGGALAAVTSAVVASRFGLGGTLIGAALASVVSTTGAALYSHAFRRTGSRVRNLIEEPPAVAKLPRFENLTRRRNGEAQSEGQSDVQKTGEGEPPARQNLQRTETAGRTPPPGAWRKTGAPAAPPSRRLPRWAVPVVATVIVFLIALAAVTGVEGIIGRPLSSVTGGSQQGSGTTLGGATGNQGGPAPAATPGTEPSNTAAPTQEPGSEPSAQPGEPTPGSAPTPGSEPASPAPSQAPSTSEPQPSAGARSSP